jgi:CubicO group peptidase (beta-lactamase class C family)
MRPHDTFRAGSLTKPFVSAVVLQLVEEGLFSLDDTLPAVLPESVTDKFADTDKMTVRMLLNHTAGLPDFMDLAGPEFIANPAKIWKAEEFLDFAAAQEPLFAPGEAQGYSNTDYTLLGMVIEEATGRSWREEMRERIFEPPKLENTLLPKPDDTTIPGDHARGYADFGGGLVDATEMVNASVVGAPGGQSLVTTPEDLARLMTAALAGEVFQKAATLDEMLTFVDWPDGNPLSPYLAGYGLGLMQATFGSGIEGVGHSGDTPGGYHTFVFHLPAQDMTISGAVNANDYEAGFVHLIPLALEALVPGFTLPEPEVGSTPPIADAEGNVIPGSIASLEKVTLGGIEQWILIRGVDTTKPVLLWLHGGPGSPEIPFVGMFQPPELESNFIVVQWDQRGTGKSYSKDLSEEDMRVENFVSDTLELTDLLRERFGQEKIFLFGHSWGSAIGFLTIMENSEPYYAYVAAAEAADWNRRQRMSYEWVLAQAREHNDTEVVQVLESVQPFDPMNLEHMTAKNQFLDRYRGGDLYTEGLMDAALDYVLSGKSPEYTSADIERTLAGMDFSRQTAGLEAAQSGYDLFGEFPVSPIPVNWQKNTTTSWKPLRRASPGLRIRATA